MRIGAALRQDQLIQRLCETPHPKVPPSIAYYGTVTNSSPCKRRFERLGDRLRPAPRIYVN